MSLAGAYFDCCWAQAPSRGWSLFATLSEAKPTWFGQAESVFVTLSDYKPAKIIALQKPLPALRSDQLRCLVLGRQQGHEAKLKSGR